MFNNRCCPEGCPQSCEKIKECTVMECPINQCCTQEFFHEVPHIIPINNHLIKKHVYNHVYIPQYTCSEETVMIDNGCGGQNR